MTKTLKKILSRGALGTGIGNIISMLVALVIGIAGKNPQMTIYDYAKYTCAATVIGFAFAAASLLFESERISLLKATGLHFLCLAAVFYPCALLAGWYAFKLGELAVSFAVFAGVYVCMWLGIYFGMKTRVKRLNAELKSRKNAR